MEDLCFDAQQAAEKAIKAVMMSQEIEFPYTHDIAHLLGMLTDDGLPVSDSVLRATTLTPFAAHTRYPGLDEPVEEPEYLRAIEIAEAVVRWAERQL